MKLSAALILASATAVSANMAISGKNAAKVLRVARRVEEGQQGDDAAVSYDYLSKYSLKMIGCKSGETVVDAQTGETEYNAVMFRLCPSESGCDSSTVTGCTKGYGDFVVGLNTFVNAYFEDQRDNMNWDDQFDVDRYAECGEYKIEDGDDDGENKWADYQFFIGPTCTADELDIKLALFTDETCTTPSSSVSFGDISNGWTLPYGSGGLVSTSCTDCVDQNDNGEYELREMCTNLYMESAYGCESTMEYFSYYGQNVQGCEYIEEIKPAAAKEKKGGKVFGWFVFILLVGGLAGYIVWWRKKKSTATDGLVA
jgi:hypothetical protein